MKMCISSSLVLAGCLAVAPVSFAQQQPPSNPQQPAQSPPGAAGNPFPEDTNTVPLLPSAKSAGTPAGTAEPPPDIPAGLVSLPARDADPARSPDEAEVPASGESGSESSSSVPGMDRMQPSDNEDTGRHGKGKAAPEYHESAANDIDVGNYELSRKNWKAALSRFQSAMVLDPQNPDVYWGIAEASRHLGDFAIARGYYELVYDYDPESRHGKEARKALKDPEIANAQAAKVPPAAPQK